MSTFADGDLEALTRLSSLVDPVRRRLYEFVASRPGPVTRDEVAAATGIARALAAYHLDKLTDARLVEAGYARPEGRSGPGAGRPAKHYVRTDRQLSVSLRARSYLLMAHLLADAVTAEQTGSVQDAAAEAARQAGRAATHEQTGAAGLATVLRDCGYEPADTREGDIELRNCPFQQLAETHTELVCGLNLDLIEGMLEGAGEPADLAVLSPAEDRCCVVVQPPREPDAQPPAPAV